MRALHWMALATLLQPCLQGCAREADNPGTHTPADAAASTSSLGGGCLGIPGTVDCEPIPVYGPGHGDDANWTPPRRHCSEELRLTPEALAQRVEGTLIAKCLITVEGTARSCRIIKSLPFMDEAAIHYLQRCSYTPATYRGKPMEGDAAFALRLRPPSSDAGFQGVAEDSAKVRK